MRASDVLKAGDVIDMQPGKSGISNWRLAQVPEAQAALVSLDSRDGAIRALVGGYSFATSSYNRAIQGRGRQVGSAFKPFIYAAALDKGLTPATVMLDAPFTQGTWSPENANGKYSGPMSMREALVWSKNMVSIRVLKRIGIDYSVNFISQFGFEKKRLGRDLSLALGSYCPPLRGTVPCTPVGSPFVRCPLI